MKKTLSIILCVMMLCSLLSNVVLAENNSDDTSEQNQQMEGSNQPENEDTGVEPPLSEGDEPQDLQLPDDVLPDDANTQPDGVTDDAADLSSEADEEEVLSEEETLPALEVDFDFVFDASTGTITAYVGEGGNVEIPSQIDGVDVKSIGSSAFYSCTSLTSVTIPSSVTSIGDNAFKYCSNLTNITIPSSVTSIGTGAFDGCSNLNILTDSVADGTTTVDESDKSEEVAVEPTHDTDFNFDMSTGTIIKYIGSGGKVEIPRQINQVNVTSIGAGSFYGCSNLTSVVIPDTVTSIGAGAFYECSSLTHMIMPDSVTNIEAGAFDGCSNLKNTTNAVANDKPILSGALVPALATDFEFDESTGTITKYIGDGGSVEIPSQINGKNVIKIGDSAFDNCSSVTSVIVPSSVSSIGNDAFYNCIGLTSITMTNNITSIGGYAFYYCYNLTSITIPSNITSIKYSTFAYCSKLNNITIPNNVTSIESNAFQDCSGLTSITIPSGVTSIGSYAFSNCYNLNSVTIQNGVGSIQIQSFAFQSCNSLTSIAIPKSVTYIGWGAFSYCNNLTSITVVADNPNYLSENGVLFNKEKTTVVECLSSKSGSYTIPDGVTSIGGYAFYSCSSLTGITMPDGVTSIGYCAFQSCSSLTSINIPDGVTRIENSAFQGCNSLNSINIPNGVTYIGYSAFESCRSLPSINIPNSVETIGDYAFQNCIEFPSVNIPDSVTSIGLLAFGNCTKLTSITVEASNTTYMSEDGVLFNKAKDKLIEYPTGKSGDYTIPNGVTSIESNAFYYCSKLTGITIPDSIKNIKNYAFAGCSGLSGVIIPDSVTSIEYCAFQNCSGLTSITISNNVASIEYDTFYNCGNLTNIIIPESVKSIKSYAFYYCSNLTEITMSSNLTSIETYAFYRCSKLPSIIIPNGVTSIKDYTFYDCTSLTNITVSDNLASIGSYAFYNCNKLPNITIPSKVNNIGNSAFQSCSSLTSIIIPNSVTSIGSSAFQSCSKLTNVTIEETATIIGSSAFANCSNPLTILTFPDSVAEGYAFENSINGSIKVSYINDNITIKITIPNDIDSSQYSNMLLTVSGTDIDNIDTKLSATTTDSRQYTFGGITIGKNYEVTLTNKFGDIIGKVDNIKATRRINTATLTPNTTKLVKVTVYKDSIAQANDVTSSTIIKWYDENGNYLTQGDSISSIPVGTKLNYTITLSSDLSTDYVLPAQPQPPYYNHTVNAIDSDNNIPVTLTKALPIKLSGTVYYKDKKNNKKPLNGAKVLISQYVNGKHFLDISTTASGGSGYFEEQIVPNRVTNVTISKQNYITKIIENVQTNFNGNDYDMGEIELLPITGAQIKLNVSYTDSATGNKKTHDDFSKVKFTLFNQTQNQEIKKINGKDVLSGFAIQDSYIIITAGANENDNIVITVSSENDDFKDVTKDFTIDKENLELDIVQNGSFKATYESSSNTNNVAIVYDSNGKHKKTYDFSNNTVKSDILEDGEYDIVFIGKSPFLNRIQKLSDLLGLLESKYYKKQKVTITGGQVTEISETAIPELDESALYYTDNANTYFTTSKTNGIAGSYFALRNQYAFKDEYKNQVSNIKVIYSFPKDCELLPNSVRLGEDPNPAYTYSNYTLTMDVKNTSDIVKFYAMPSKAGTYTIEAFLQFDINGSTIKQPMGVVKLEATDLAIDVIEKTIQKTVTGSGITTSNSRVTVYDNGLPSGETTSLLNGSWSVKFDLDKTYTYSLHNIHAEVIRPDDLKIISETKSVIYDKLGVVPSKVTMMYRDGNLIFNFLQPSTKQSIYSYLPSISSFTFVAEFAGNTSLVSKVYINVWTTSGTIESLPATYDKNKNIWVATGNFGTYSLPTNVSVSYECSPSETVIDADYENDLHQEFADEFKEEIKMGSGYTFAKKIPNADGFNEISFSRDGNSLTYKYKQLDYNSSDIQNLINNKNASRNTSTGSVIYCKNNGSSNALSLTMVDTENKKAYDIILDGSGSNSLLELSKEQKELENALETSEYRNFARIIDAFDLIVYGTGSGLNVGKHTNYLSNMNDNLRKFQQFYNSELLKLTDDCIPDDAKVSASNTLMQINSAYENSERVNFYIKSTLFALANLLELTGEEPEILNHYTSFGFDALTKKQQDSLYEDVKTAITIAQGKRTRECTCKPNKIPRPNTPNVTPILDPSGYVYEAVASNRVKGVTTTLFYKKDKNDATATLWDATEYQQENPLTTDANGAYAWDVPEGWWQVKYEKEGYETTYSDWLKVPPPQVDVNVGIISFVQPKIEHVNGYENYIEIVFDKYMQTSTFIPANIKVKKNGNYVSGSIETPDAEENPKKSDEMFARKVHFKPDAKFSLTDSVELQVSSNVKSYAGSNLKSDYSGSVTICIEPKEITASETVTLAYGESGNIEVSISPKEAATGKKVKAVSNSLDIATVEAEAVVDNEGKAYIPVTANMTGTAYVTLTLDGTDLQKKTEVQVGIPKAPMQKVVAPVSSVPAGSVTYNTQIQLYTSTFGAVIYYTTDGTVPTTSSTTYSSPISITSSITINAIAVKDGMQNSDVLTITFTTQPPTSGSEKAITPVLEQKEITSATITVTMTQITEALKNMTTSIVEVKAYTDDKATKTTVLLPEKVINQLTNSKINGVAVDTGIATVTLNKTAIDTLSKEDTKDGVTLSVEKIDVNTLPQSAQIEIVDKPVFDFTIMVGKKTVSSFGNGGTAIISVPYTPKQSEDINAIVIYYIEDNGNITVIPNCSYDPTTKKVSFKVSHFSKYAVGYRKISFADVSGGVTSYVSYLSARGIVNGIGDNKFAPQNDITRAEFVKVLACIARADVSSYKSSKFSDVATNSWYMPYVAWSSKMGIVNGIGDNRFAPDEKITREEMAVIITRFANHLKYILPSIQSKITFADNEKISSWAKKAVEVVQVAGIINGKGNNIFDPQAKTTRANAVKMLAEFCQNYYNPYSVNR